ncbi:copper chaperone for superoxide dismutase [Chelonus insularis]|uniref:copper chaperone for superoxide dismutase n=1 Tax=Chelonus insularis TaxID=460826 RepID=UPI00158BF1AB|nr:copper chaperone for superoxide dismutase [Chelonus insularis]
MTTKIEFAVEMTCKNCINAVENSLKELQGIDHFEILFDKQTVVVETAISHTVIQEAIEKVGKKAVLKGYGYNESNAAVAMIDGVGLNLNGNNNIQGLVRFAESNEKDTIIDGTIDGLSPGLHGLHIHECGDITKGCASVGPHYNPHEVNHGGREDDVNNRHLGDLGNIIADKFGRASFRFNDKLLRISDIIGRSIVVSEKEDDLGKGKDVNSSVDGNSGKGIACGIIARSAGLFQNSKKICVCDGKTLWDERNEYKEKGIVPLSEQQASNCDIS